MIRRIVLPMLLVAAFAFAQDRPTTAPATLPATRPTTQAIRGPMLRVTDPGAATQPAGITKPMTIANLDVQSVVLGFAAQTTMTFTFANDNDRVMESEFMFPLPDGATVCGYGLDVDGSMVDGVAVEKDEARRIVETEIRGGIDPGLVEHVAGNVFRTRIYPIPAKGTRMVRIQYLSEIAPVDGRPALVIPMAWDVEVGNVKVQVQAPAGAPGEEFAVRSTPIANPQRTATDKYQFIRLESEKKKLSGDLVVSVARLADQFSAVEKRYRPALSYAEAEAKTDAKQALGVAEHYFVISDEMPRALLKRLDWAPRVPQRVLVVWDASLSRQDCDREKELALLAKLAPGAKVDLWIVHDTVEKKSNLTMDAAIALLKDLPFDGGTDLSRLDLSVLAGIDCCFLFTDGYSSLRPFSPAKPAGMPVHAVSSTRQTNHALLRTIARNNGGQRIDLAQMAVEDATKTLMDGYGLRGFTIDRGKCANVNVTEQNGRTIITGQLLADEATVKLRYGFFSADLGQQEQRTYILRQAEAADNGNVVPRLWAQQRVAELSTSPAENRAEMLKIGREFGMVTPVTSLLVLETVDQYVRHRVVPPLSRPELYAQFMQKIEQGVTQRQKTSAEHLEQVVQKWQERVAWWEKEFKYPKDFVFGLAASRPTTGAADPASPMAIPPSIQGIDLNARAGPRASFFGSAGNARRSEALPTQTAAVIQIKPWNPDTPYLKAMKAAGAEGAYAEYLRQRPTYRASPAFYVDCADYLLSINERALAVRILTNLAEISLDDPAILRIAAYRLSQMGQHDLAIAMFRTVLGLRPEEPQSYRDLALALADCAAGTPEAGAAFAQYSESLGLFNTLITRSWDDRFAEIEIVALMEANRIIARANALPMKVDWVPPLDRRLRALLDLDARIVLTWDADKTDIDLHVVEPSGERAFYSHNRTAIGGLVSRDFTRGYGPEEYCLRRAMPGEYKIIANYYGSSPQKLTGPVTIQATVITNFGRPDENRQSLTVRVSEKKDNLEIGTIKIGQ